MLGTVSSDFKDNSNHNRTPKQIKIIVYHSDPNFIVLLVSKVVRYFYSSSLVLKSTVLAFMQWQRKGILTLHHLYVHRTFVELFKVQKHRLPISIYELFDMSNRSNNFSLNLPKLKLDTSRHNFLYNSSLIWNELIGKILEKSNPNSCNIMIPGSSPNSDLSASISLVKKRLKNYLLGLQEVDVPTRPNEWLPLNFCKYSLNDQLSSWNSRLQEKFHIPRIKPNQIYIFNFYYSYKRSRSLAGQVSIYRELYEYF